MLLQREHSHGLKLFVVVSQVFCLFCCWPACANGRGRSANSVAWERYGTTPTLQVLFSLFIHANCHSAAAGSLMKGSVHTSSINTAFLSHPQKVIA